MTTKSPLVTVVIPAYNAEATLRETIGSVEAQSYANTQIIVVDDGSVDATEEIARSFSNVLYMRQKNSGSCAVPRNSGMREAKGDFLTFLDADDLMPVDRLSTQVEFLGRHPSVGAVISNYANFTSAGREVKTHFETCPLLMQHLDGRHEAVVDRASMIMLEEFFGIAGSFLMRRELMESLGGFHPDLRAGEDFHFLYRLAKITRIGVISKVGLLRRIHGANMSGNFSRMNREAIKVAELLLSAETDPASRVLLRRVLSRHHQGWGRHCANSRELGAAIASYLQAMRYDARVRSCMCAFRGCVRGLAIYLRLFRSSDRAAARALEQ